MAPKNKLTPSQITSVCERYCRRERAADLATEYGVHIQTIYNAMRQNNIALTANFRNLSPEEICEVKSLYASGLTSYAIADLFGVCRPTISFHIRKEPSDPQARSLASRRYTCNHGYFDSVDTPEKAYWLGFVMADGCIRAGNQLTINLSNKDKNHLEAFRDSLGSSHPVSTYHYNKAKPPYSTAYLSIASTQMTEALARYAIVARKTFTCVWPSLPDSLYRHFLRGLLDADGCVKVEKHGLSIGLLGAPALVIDCQKHLAAACSLALVKLQPHNRKDTILSMTYAGNIQVLRIANYLYEDATVFLPRKRDKVLDHYRSLPKYRDQLRFG